MMRLSTMWAVDRAIDPEGRSAVIDRIVARWPHDEGSARFFRSSANFIATFEHDGQLRFLRFADSTERRRQAIQAELDLVLWLAGEGLNVSVPQASLNGSVLEAVEVDDRTFFAVAFAACSGAQFASDDLDREGFRRWGNALGGLHAALKSYPNAAPGSFRMWSDDLAFIDALIPPDTSEVRTEFLELQAMLRALPTAPDDFGIIHFDYELDNLVWSDSSIATLDFDDCARCWYAADIAFALRDLFDAGRALDDPAVRAFLDGYTSQIALDGSMLNAIPTFSRLARLFTYARLVRTLDLVPSPEYPDWLNNLIMKLRAHIHAYRLSLTES